MTPPESNIVPFAESQLPSVAGFYWWKEASGYPWQIVQVFVGNGEHYALRPGGVPFYAHELTSSNEWIPVQTPDAQRETLDATPQLGGGSNLLRALTTVMDTWSDYQRIHFLNRIHGHYCKYCGAIHFRGRECQCENHE